MSDMRQGEPDPFNDYPEIPRVFFPKTQSAWALRCMRLLGWRLDFEGMPGPYGVAIVYPHTSNWDFPIAMIAKSAVGIKARFMAKDSLFKWPIFGKWLRHLGGLAIDRSRATGVVAQMVEHFKACQDRDEMFWLGVAPEGTRKFQKGWKTGFYQIALQANVPLLLVHFDHGRKVISVRQCIRLSGDMQRDFARMAKAYEGVRGYHPENASTIEPWVRDMSEST
jgi:1-acyl-sn-glycerol-3-phosphate acyltransferase